MIKKLIPVGIIIILVLYGVNVNNGLVNKQENVKEAWSQVETQYQRRSDLIPNLVATVKGAANFEKSTLTAVTEARSKATSIQVDPSKLSDPQVLQNFQQAQSQLSGALSRLLVTVERYPDLKANQNFRDLQVQLEGTENRITVARQRYNDAARGYNTSVRRFPTNLLAGVLGFKSMAYFKAEKGSEKAPQVKF
jgi:LemA protein